MLIKKNITFSLEIKGKVTKKKRNDQLQLENIPIRMRANRIKKSGRIKKAITQIGRKIVVDKKMALELAGQPVYHRRGA